MALPKPPHKIIEDYICTTSKAVLDAAYSLENQPGLRVRLSNDYAAKISAILYGVAPKPSVKNVAILADRAHVSDPELAKEILLSISAASLGKDFNRERAEEATNRIGQIIDGITVVSSPPFGAISTAAAATTCPISFDALVEGRNAFLLSYEQDDIYVGQTKNGDPVVDFSKYRLVDNKASIESSSDKTTEAPSSKEEKNKQVNINVEKSMNELLSEIIQNVPSSSPGPSSSVSTSNFKQYVDLVSQKVLPIVLKWGNSLENELKIMQDVDSVVTANKEEGEVEISNTSAVNITRRALIDSKSILEPIVAEANKAVLNISHLVGRAFGRTVTQLTSVEELDKLVNNLKECEYAIKMNALEKILSRIFFYVNFKHSKSNLDIVKNKLAIIAGVKPNVQHIERRSREEILFGLCYLLKILPPFCTQLVMAHGIDSRTEWYGKNLVSDFLTGYGTCSEKPWQRCHKILNSKSQLVSEMLKNGERIDSIDASVKQLGPVYVVISDAALAFEQLNVNLEKFIIDIREKYNLWKIFVEGKSATLINNE